LFDDVIGGCIFITMAAKDYEPVKRSYHSTVRVGDYLYMWGGDQSDLPKVHNNDKKKALSSLMEVYHLPTGRWEQKPTTGNPPLGILGYASAAIGNEIFYFGGRCNHDSCFHNSLYSFNVDTFTWRELSPTTPHHGPMMKGYCSMVAFQVNGEDYLAVIGGQGPSSNNTPTQPNAQYDSNGLVSGLKRTNEIHYYKVSSGKCSSPNVTGDRPPPISAFTLTSITNDYAILFGGNNPNGDSNNTYIVNFSHTSVNFSYLEVSKQKPKERRGHSSVFISSNLGPHLLVVNGFYKDDCWLLDINKRIWKQLLKIPRRISYRWYHSMSVWSITPTIDWINVFGGGSRYKDTAVIELNIVDMRLFIEHFDILIKVGLLVKYLWTNIKRNCKKGEENGKHLNLSNLIIIKTRKEK
uniref:Kelch domain-containing protein n=1 Tax=Amphimedon queenslandica TaxID=400682 RepID=A0A1X7U8D9_AMPQE